MDYYGLKRILQEIHISQAQKLTKTPIRTLQQGVEIEESIRTRLLLPCEEIEENEVKFFKKLDQELDKVNAFYRNKVDEVIKEAAELKKQLEACIALRIKVQNSGIKASEAAVAVECLWSTTQEAPSVINTGNDRENTGSTNDESDVLNVLNRVKINTTFQGPLSMGRGKEQLKQVEKKQLIVAFREFYQKLRLLKSYSFMNISAFAKIMKKYEKTTSKWAARSYMKIVDKSYLGSCDEEACIASPHFLASTNYKTHRRCGTLVRQALLKCKSKGRHEAFETKEKKRKARCIISFRPLFWLFNCTCHCHYSHGASKENTGERKGLLLHGEHDWTL